MKRIVASLLLSLCVVSSALSAEQGWTVDFAAAKAAAAKDKKDLFLEFTGSDWCPPCKRLKAEILDHDAFKKAVPEHFVLVKLDFPNDKSQQTTEEIAQNRELQKHYEIAGFPTVILADPTGRAYSKTVGFPGITAEDYVKKLVASRKVREARDAAFAEAEKAAGIEQAKLLDKGLASMDEELVAGSYKVEVNKIIAADADGKAGLKAKYQAMLLLPAMQRALEEIQQSGDDAPSMLKQIDELIAKMSATGQALQEAHFTKAVIVYGSGDKAGAKTHMEAAIAAAPTTRKATEIQGLMKRIYAAPDPQK